jgi:phosphate-selective porin OprO/OprP
MRLSDTHRVRSGSRSKILAAAIMMSLGAASVHADELSDLRQRLDAQEQQIKALERRLEAREAGSTATTDTAKLEEQAQQIKVLERKLELQHEADDAAAKSAAVVKASPKGFSLASADGRNVIKFKGNYAFDGRWFTDDVTPDTADTWLLRKVRPAFEGTLYGIFDYRLQPDFAGGKSIILDAYASVRLRPWAVIQVGKFKGPVGLERLQADQFNRFMELGLPSALVPNRDMGVQWSGAVGKGAVSWQLGYFSGAADGSSTDSNTSPDTDNDGRKEWQGRVFTNPFAHSDIFALRNLGFGIGGSYGNRVGSPTAPLLTSVRTPGQQSISVYRANTATSPLNNATYADGDAVRWSPQLYYSWNNVGLLSEYVESSQDVSRQVSAAQTRSATIDNSAWQVQLAWFITGEDESYSSFDTQNPFRVNAPGWGAWELVARYHELRFDDAAFFGGANSFADPARTPRSISAYGVGLNWYLNQNVKWQLDYEISQFDGGTASGEDRGDENALFTRFALTF